MSSPSETLRRSQIMSANNLQSVHLSVAEEWRHLAGLHQDDVGSIALVLGALVLAPAIEVRC